MMQFETWGEFFAMGHHGLYVWLAYGVTTLVLLAFPLMLRNRRRKLLRELTWQFAAEAPSDVITQRNDEVSDEPKA